MRTADQPKQGEDPRLVLSRAVHDHRLRLGISQEDLADQVGSTAPMSAASSVDCAIQACWCCCTSPKRWASRSVSCWRIPCRDRLITLLEGRCRRHSGSLPGVVGQMTRLWILSDLHLEVFLDPDAFRPEPPDCDVLVVAGDVWQGQVARALAVVQRLAGVSPP